MVFRRFYYSIYMDVPPNESFSFVFFFFFFFFFGGGEGKGENRRFQNGGKGESHIYLSKKEESRI
jgi:hypothetical protein